jgi:Zn-dependent protease with chaperone function
MSSHRTSVVLASFALLLASGVVPADAQTRVKRGFNLFSEQQDVEIGQQSAAEAEKQLLMLTDRTVEDYVSRIGAKLADQAPGHEFPYRFRVVNSTDLNAFALPGGPVYLNRGVLEAARNEGEIAGVLAHEIAHVSLRHGTHNVSQAYLAQTGLGLLGGLIGGGGNTAGIVEAVGGFGLNVAFLKYSRKAETEADIIGAQILPRAGYNPADMISFFDTIEATDKRRTTNFLSSHPAPADRRARITQEAEKLGVALAPTQKSSELASVQARLKGMPRPSGSTPVASGSGGTTSPSSGALRVPPPSRELRTHTVKSNLYRVSYPSNWRTFEEGENGATFAPEGGIVSAGKNRTDVVYGAIVNHYEPFDTDDRAYRSSLEYDGEITVEEATNDLIRQLQASSPYLKVQRGTTRRTTVDEGEGLAATLAGTNTNTGRREVVRVVTRQLHDDHLVYLLFVTPDDAPVEYDDLYRAMVRSLRIAENLEHD